MWRALKQWWRYLGMWLRFQQEAGANPRIQLEQAIEEAEQDHRRLTDQAATVIANQKQAQVQLDRAVDAHRKANGLARQALMLADQEKDAAKLARFNQAAEDSARELLRLEEEIRDREDTLIQATSAAEDARTAVAQNEAMLKKRLAEKEHLLRDLDQAKMQEQLNAALRVISSTLGAESPTLVDVRKKIDEQHFKAIAEGELSGRTVDRRMFEVEQELGKSEAQARLALLKSELGLGGKPTDSPQSGAEPEQR